MNTLRRIVSAISLSFFALSAMAAYQDVVIADQPVGYWRLGEPAGSATATNAGSLGPAADGTVMNNVTFETPGAINADLNTAAHLDGAQAKIEVPFHAELNASVFTIEAWAKTAFDSSGYRSPLASRDDFPQRGYIFYADPSENWQFWTGNEAGGWAITGGATVQPDVWTHLVGVYDGTNKFFYVNGVLVGASQTAVAENTARLLRIGGSATENPVGDFFFNGDVDEVAVYNKALSSDRVLAHHNSGSATPAATDVFPAIAVQPTPLNRFRNESASFTALATGSLPFSYQWIKDGEDVAGATGMTLTLNNLQTTNTGSYSVRITNPAGEVVSDAAQLDVADVVKPVITQQPRSVTLFAGNNASFTVAASGSTTFQYQWQRDGQNIAHGTNATLVITNAQTADLGTYQVIVTNPAGSTTSDPATLKFPVPATKSYVQTVKEDAPTGYWRLGESEGEIADDEIGENNGSYLNGVTLGKPGALIGDPNTAAGFTAANLTKVDVQWSDVLNAPVFTVECWAKVTGGSGHRSPLTSRADGPQRGYIFYAEPGNTWQFWVGNAAGGWATIQGPAVQPNAYAHLVGLYDGTTLHFYVNGVLAGRLNVAFAPNDLSPLRIGAGASETDGNFFFEGDVDEVAVFDKALGDERILAHYVAGIPLTTPPTITTDPISQFAPPGATVSFSVAATGPQPLSYQWKLNNQNISFGTNSTLTLTNVTSAETGTYVVEVKNAGGTKTSLPATLTIPTPSTKTYEELVKGDAPVSYWRLGETEGDIADDEIGENNGSYLNGVTLGAQGAIPNDPDTAAGFTTASQTKIDVPWSPDLNSAVFSAEVWAKVTGGTAHRSPLTSRADLPQRGYIFYAVPGNIWQFWSGRGDSTGWDIIGNTPVEIGKWTHLAATYDGTIKRFYVDGVLRGTSTGAFGPNDEAALRIGGGASEGPGNYFFEGEIDEPAIYNKVLTHEQVILHYLAGIPPDDDLALEFVRTQGGITLTWEKGTLESATSVNGTWEEVLNASSPHSVTTTGTTRFFRLSVPE